ARSPKSRLLRIRPCRQSTTGASAAGPEYTRLKSRRPSWLSYQYSATALHPFSLPPCPARRWCTFQQSAVSRAMKYRHGFHAGNFADVHKHVTQLALLAALERKDKRSEERRVGKECRSRWSADH